jgi:hypothetical protein
MPSDVPLVYFVLNYLAAKCCLFFGHSRSAESCANSLARLYWQGIDMQEPNIPLTEQWYNTMGQCYVVIAGTLNQP